jgi:uncharacterized C2H2 Zn-finger protein
VKIRTQEPERVYKCPKCGVELKNVKETVYVRKETKE